MKTKMTTLGLISFFQMLSFAAVLQAISLPVSGPLAVKGVALTFAETQCTLKEIAKESNRNILFVAQSEKNLYYFKRDGISLKTSLPEILNHFELNQVYSIEEQATGHHQLDMFWEGMNKNVHVYGAEEVNTAYTSRMEQIGHSKDCVIKNYRKLYYSELYPGIDLRYYERDNQLKYDIIVKPGFDYKDIKMRFTGTHKLSVDSNGGLVIRNNNGTIRYDAPLVLQNGKPLIAKWVVHSNIAGLQIMNYQADIELCIQSGIGFNNNMESGIAN